MTHVQSMAGACTQDFGTIDKAKLAECIQACFECAQACTACADACLKEDMVAELTRCVRTNLDCVDICVATGKILSRHDSYDAGTTRAVIEACRTACRPAPKNAGSTPPCTATAKCAPKPAGGASRPAPNSSPAWAKPQER